jgi:hypothetical protein
MFPRISFPSRVITLLWLIVLPSILLIILEIDWYNLSVTSPTTTPASIVVTIPFVLLFFIYLFAFAAYLHDVPNNYAKYSKETHAVEAVKEYQFSKKLFYVAAAISIFSLFLFLSRRQTVEGDIYFFGFFLTIFPLATVILGTRFAAQYARKDFGFYLARAYYMVSSREGDIIKKFKYLTLTLDTYNKFLERNLKLQIKDIMRIYSIFISASIEQQIKIRESIGNAFEKDELELARQLAELSNLQDKEQFLIRERAILNQQFRDILTIIIPAIISVVGFIAAILTQIMEPLG